MEPAKLGHITDSARAIEFDLVNLPVRFQRLSRSEIVTVAVSENGRMVGPLAVMVKTLTMHPVSFD
jgi:hypothetical protein